MDPTPPRTCAFHPDRRAGVGCQRCGRPICPDCMHTASVGFHCPECAKVGRQQVRTMASIRAGTDPIVTKVLIAANVVAFLATSFGGGGLGQTGGSLYIDGLLIGGRIFSDVGFIGVDAGEWWRIVTGGFLHANLMHIGFNMFLLWLLGSELEPVLGRVRFGLLYGVSLLAGSFGVLLLDPVQPTVGASGAVFGLMGALLIAQRAVGVNPWQSGIGGLVAINLVFTFLVPNISIGGHLGGLVGGAVIAALFIELPRRVKLGDRRQATIVASALVALFGVACFVGSLWAAGNWVDQAFG
ncbi:MAG: rhomboid family intramembrane serine protease [Acidimicrobiales bacterium]|nr:rhomboid family intramembrane serine protease [Acidimicrobiales bacterium]